MEHIHGLLVTHKRAPQEEIERLHEFDARFIMETAMENGASEAFVLQTCNRSSLYISGPSEVLTRLSGQLDIDESVVEHVHGEEVARQLFRVASGLESMVVGEDEILGQVSDAYETALNFLDGPLDAIVEKAIRVGKRIRSETEINEGNMSMGTAATAVARDQFGGLEDVPSLVIGAGDMGEAVAKSLRDNGASVTITNRSYESANRISDEIDAAAACFGDISGHLNRVDLVITATGAPHPILTPSELRDTSVTVVDIATPRDVKPGTESLEGIEVFDIDDIGDRLNSTFQRRMNAAKEAEGIIDEELTLLMQHIKQQRADEMLRRIHTHADEIRSREMDRAICRTESALDLKKGEQEQLEEILDDLTSAIVGQLLSTPTESIKGAAMEEKYETLQAIADAFDLSQLSHESFESDALPAEEHV